MKLLVSSLPEGTQIVTYADDIVIFAKTRKEVASISKTLRAAVEQHPAGQLSLKRAEIYLTANDFDFLGYHLCSRKGKERVRPSKENLQRAKNLAEIDASLVLLGMDPITAIAYLKCWAASFPHWRLSARWLNHKISLIQAAKSMFELGFMRANGCSNTSERYLAFLKAMGQPKTYRYGG
ncbi:MAG: hypothetical protein JW384_03505 [Nitrosomonadaceae bacterium]|nr:hypothetical protein [Nitrosomonadaceae bacterium]